LLREKIKQLEEENSRLKEMVDRNIPPLKCDSPSFSLEEFPSPSATESFDELLFPSDSPPNIFEMNSSMTEDNQFPSDFSSYPSYPFTSLCLFVIMLSFAIFLPGISNVLNPNIGTIGYKESSPFSTSRSLLNLNESNPFTITSNYSSFSTEITIFDVLLEESVFVMSNLSNVLLG